MSQLPAVQTASSPALVLSKDPSDLMLTGQAAKLATQVATPEGRSQLVCKLFLSEEDRKLAIKDANNVLSAILANDQVLTSLGLDTLDAVNSLNDEMLRTRPNVDIPELHTIMKGLTRHMHNMGQKYDPKDPEVRKRYQEYESWKARVFSVVHRGKTFMDEFTDDIKSIDNQFNEVIKTLNQRREILVQNIGYYTEYYDLNEKEIAQLEYVIAVMEYTRDMANEMASQVDTSGSTNQGDRSLEQQSNITEIGKALQSRITAFQGRLFVAWAMSPQIRTMRAISRGLVEKIDETVGITIPTMKDTIVAWRTLSEAERAAKFNALVNEAANETMVMFANAAGETMPFLMNELEKPALEPHTVEVWAKSIDSQANAMVASIETGRQQRAELEQTINNGKRVIDAATMRVNQAMLNQALTAAKNSPLEITSSVQVQS